ITNRPGPAVKLEGRRGEETSTGKDAAFHMTQPAVAKGPEPGHAFRLRKSGTNDMLDENLPRHLDRGHLQLLFRSEVGEQAALAHLQFLGQAADGETLQALHRSQIDGHAQDAVARAGSFSRKRLRGPWGLYWSGHRHEKDSIAGNIIARTFVFVRYCR